MYFLHKYFFSYIDIVVSIISGLILLSLSNRASLLFLLLPQENLKNILLFYHTLGLRVVGR
jgi:hypothetical protein